MQDKVENLKFLLILDEGRLNHRVFLMAKAYFLGYDLETEQNNLHSWLFVKKIPLLGEESHQNPLQILI